MFSVGAVTDPFAVRYRDGIQVTAGRAIRPSRLSEGERTLILVGAGQSNIASSESATYTPTHGTKIDNINVYDGGIYEAKDPILGPGFHPEGAGGNWMVRLADKFIAANRCDRVILSSVALGSTSVQDWAPDGLMNPSLIVINRRLAALGLSASMILWAQGETDNNLGTSTATYLARLQSVIASLRAQGFAAPWLIGKSTYTGGVTSSAVRTALAQVVNGTDILEGADTDDLGPSYRWGNVHYNALGADTVSGRWLDRIVALGLA